MIENIDECVWYSELDDLNGYIKRYSIRVIRLDRSNGILKVYDTKFNNKLIFEKQVQLSYGAMFGPDISDVDIWKEIVIKFVDEEYK